MTRCILLLCLSLCSATLVQATPQDDDFAARCAAPGVVYCGGLDAVGPGAHQIDAAYVIPDSFGTYRYAIDTSIKTSGAGSLRFDVPPPPHGGANIAGSWTPTAVGSTTGGETFKHNETFYYQYRARFGKWLLDNIWPINNSWKVGFLYRYPVPCERMGLVLINWYSTDIITGYSACGSMPFITDTTTNLWQPSNDGSYYLQQGDYPCRYANYTTDPCLRMTPNEWFTVYAHIELGAWASAGGTSRVRYYIATEKAPTYKLFIDVAGIPLDCAAPPGCNNDTDALQAVSLDGAYMTQLPRTAGGPYPTQMWYDELIVSLQPIAAPGVMVPASNHISMKRTSGGSVSGGGRLR
jgi:hypothetical protein